MSEEISFEQILSLVRREQTRQDLQEIDNDLYKNTVALLKSKEKQIRANESQQSLVSTNVELEKEKRLVLHIRKQLNDLIDLRQKKIINSARMRAKLPSTIINNELLTSEEKNFFDKTVNLFREFKSNLLNQEQSNEQPQSETSKEKELPKIDPKQDEASEEKTEENTEKPTSQDFKSEETKEKEVQETKEEFTKQETEKTETPKIEEKKEEVSETQNTPKTVKVKFLVDMPKFYGTSKEILGPFKQGEVAEVPELIANALVRKGRAELQNE